MEVILLASMAPFNNTNLHIGLNIIEQAFLEQEIKPSIKHISEFDPTSLKENSIVGISSYYESLDRCIEKAKEIKKSGNHFIVLGGQGTYNTQINKELLNIGVFDALNMGHAAPFVEMVKQKYINPSLSLEQLAFDNDIATPSNPTFKNGAFPNINKFPLKTDRFFEKVRIVIPPMRGCPNNCDYCTESIIRVPDLTDKLIEALNEFQEHTKIDLMTFASPTFNEPNIADAKKILSAMRHKPETAFYLDSNQLTLNLSGLIAQLDEFNATHAYIGLNAINNNSARYLGRKLGNTIRTNITAEKNAIIKFLKTQRDVKGSESYTISIMLSKAEDRRSFLQLIDYTNELTHIAAEYKKNINIQMFNTIAYPGTLFHKNHGGDYLVHPREGYTLTMPSQELSYHNKNAEFLKRSLNAVNHLAKPNNFLEMLVGLNGLALTYEYLYENKMTTILYKNKKYEKMIDFEKEFILNPEKFLKK